MNDFDEIRAQAERDLEIDQSNLDKDSAHIPLLYSKYLSIYHKFRIKYLIAEDKHKKLKAKKYFYYRNDYDIIPKNSSEIEILLGGDAEYTKSEIQLRIISDQLEYSEKVLKMIEMRGYQIKNIIDWQKFQQGA